MKFDVEGRIRNMKLPDPKSLIIFSVYEAVSNAIHAVERRRIEEKSELVGKVQVELRKNSKKKIDQVIITDDGIGLNAKHLDAFETCDTRDKVEIGGKGVGRLIWHKSFESIDVESRYREGSEVCSVSFTFRPDLEESLQNKVIAKVAHATLGTTIKLSGVRAEAETSLTLALVARNLSHHFFAYFLAAGMPQLVVSQGKREVDIGQYLADRMSEESSEDIDLSPDGLGKISLTHVYVDPKIARALSNSLLFTAQGRVVLSHEIERKFALKGLQNRKAYTCVIRGEVLDSAVDQERTTFKLSEEALEKIKASVLDRVEKFLGEHIEYVRREQKAIVVELLERHPQLAVSVPDIDGYVQNLSPGMGDEDIGKTLFTLLYRHEKKIDAELKEFEKSPDSVASEKISRLIERVGGDAQRRLAEYIVKRHQIISIAKSMLRYTDPERKAYELENVVHELICPMQRMLAGKDYHEHNLWLVDDLLSYYQFFASDKSLASLGVSGDRKEPDLLFMNPFGFRREGTNDPVVIVEFKRPGDEYLTSDPVNQVLDYIERLQNKTVRDVDGAVVGEIDRDTPFDCLIICDLTEGAKRKIERSVAQHTLPDKQGYFGFSPKHNASIKVLSYKKVFRDAELRNQSFFKHLGLVPEEVRKSLERSAEAAE